jgi:hypothetical protein
MRSSAIGGYALVGLVASGMILSGSGDTSDTGSGVGMAIFGALLFSAALTGLLGVFAGSDSHPLWAVAGLLIPGYSLPVALYYVAKGRSRKYEQRVYEEQRAAEIAAGTRCDECAGGSPSPDLRIAHTAFCSRHDPPPCTGCGSLPPGHSMSCPERCEECHEPPPDHARYCSKCIHTPSLVTGQTGEWLFADGSYVAPERAYAARCSCGYETAFHPRREDAVWAYEWLHGCDVNRAGDFHLGPSQESSGETARGRRGEGTASPRSVEFQPEGDEGHEQ